MIIQNEKFRQSILTALADKEMVSIIDHSTYRAISVNDIIKETGIPHTTAYRKINWMLEERLLAVEQIHITPEGKKWSLFKSMLRTIAVKYEQGKIIVEAEYNIDEQERTANKFFSLDSIESNKR
jgi:hypothetical protein